MLLFHCKNRSQYRAKLNRWFGLRKLFMCRQFTKKFPHDIFNPIQYDDEWMIESVALYNGYKIISEEIHPNFSSYTFELRIG